MAEAEIFGRREGRAQTPLRVASHFRHLVGDRYELAALVFGLGHLPAAVDRDPDKLEFLIGRKILGVDGEAVANLPVNGHGVHRTDIAVLGFGDVHFTAER